MNAPGAITRTSASAKLNLALVVGPLRDDGRHEVCTVLQRIGLADRVEIEPAPELRVSGYEADTLVRGALTGLAKAAGVEPRWRVRITKRIPIASGLGGGSSDAGSALLLANAALPEPLDSDRLHELAATLGADVPFFLRSGPQLGSGPGSELEPLDLPQDYWVVIVLPDGARKESTATVYREFDRRGGPDGFAARRDALREALGRVRRAHDLAGLPRNDLASSPLSDELASLGAFRADVSGAGPAVYGLFAHEAPARRAARRLRAVGRTWVTAAAWYG